MSPWVQNISRQWRRLVKKARLERKINSHNWTELHLHTLRKFYQTNCKLAGCRADFVDFWMGHHPIRRDQYLNDSYFRPEQSSHLTEYRKAVDSLTVFETGTLANVTVQLKTKDEEIKSLKESVAKMQMQIEMMMQGIVKRDRQYFEEKCPGLKRRGKSPRKTSQVLSS